MTKIAGGPRQCDIETCNRYSDVDIYFKDGTSKEFCSEHAWLQENVDQGIPQHGSDEVNVEIEPYVKET